VRDGMSAELARELGHSRQALHAHRCVLTHPVLGDRMSFEAPLADDLVDLWARLGGNPT
jgi:23S rRNA-/tRNA-specific pseudouridylate synthase